MPAPPPASILDLLLGSVLASASESASNRFSIEGLAFGAGNDGAHEVGIQKLEAVSLRVSSGPLVLEVGQLALHQVKAAVRIEGGKPRLGAVQAASAELSGVKIHGPAPGDIGALPSAASSWCLGPLAAADGTIRAKILDAHLLFDADVTVPIRQGQVRFRDATVEHVGPDSRMGVSRLGLYVDAPNGRSYLYQFPAAPVAGVEFERRGGLLGSSVTDRGNLRLQEFGEGMLRQSGGGRGPGFTEQARLLFDRTAVSGDVQLSDGRFVAPGVQAQLVGRAEGRNVVRLHSEAVGRGLTGELALLSVRNAVLAAGSTQFVCNEIAGAIVLRFFVEGGTVRFVFDLANLKISGLRLDPGRAAV
jgi:hypothetical protein